MRKINQFVGLILAVVLLLLLARFLLIFFQITTSIFTAWVYQVTGPLVYLFTNLVAPIPYNSFVIDVTTIIAAVVWLVVALVIRRFLAILFGK